MGSLCGLSLAKRKEIITPLFVSVRNGSTIKVILLEKLEKRGERGAVVKVKRGHARNHLIPQKLAAYATDKNKEKYADVINSAKEKIVDVAVDSNVLSTLIATGIEFRRTEGGSVSTEDVTSHLDSIGLVDYTLDMTESGIESIGAHKIIVNGSEIDVTVTEEIE